MLTYQNVSELCQLAEREGRTLSQVILSDQAERLEYEARLKASRER